MQPGIVRLRHFMWIARLRTNLHATSDLSSSPTLPFAPCPQWHQNKVPSPFLAHTDTVSDWEKFEKTFAHDEDPNASKKITPLDEGDIQILKSYGQGPYARALKKLDDEIKEVAKRVDEKIGVKESDMGLAPPNLWDLSSDRQRMNEEHPLQVARCTKIIQNPDDPGKGKYVINVKQIAKFGILSLSCTGFAFSPLAWVG